MSKKIIKDQTDETWSRLHQRLTTSDADLSKVLTKDFYEFVKAKASSIGTNEGYYFISMLTSINFLSSLKKVKISLREGHVLGMNFFAVFVGPPSTSKSPAFKDAVTNPLNNKNLNIISNTTSSGLTKMMSKTKSCFIANPEISEYLMRMLKNDDENCIGDCQLLCKLFSGEKCEVNYATENKRCLPEDCSFCILGKYIKLIKRLSYFIYHFYFK